MFQVIYLHNFQLTYTIPTYTSSLAASPSEIIDVLQSSRSLLVSNFSLALVCAVKNYTDLKDKEHPVTLTPADFSFYFVVAMTAYKLVVIGAEEVGKE